MRDSGKGNLCVSNSRRYSSGKYWFNGKKARDVIEVGAEGEQCQRPDTFVLEDGTEYGIVGLDDGQIGYLVCVSSCVLFAMSYSFVFTSLTKLGTVLYRPP